MSRVTEADDAKVDEEARFLIPRLDSELEELVILAPALALLFILPLALSPIPSTIIAVVAVRLRYSFAVKGSTTPGAFNPRRVKGGVIVYGLLTYHELSFTGGFAGPVPASGTGLPEDADECFKMDFGLVGGGRRIREAGSESSIGE